MQNYKNISITIMGENIRGKTYCFCKDFRIWIFIQAYFNNITFEIFMLVDFKMEALRAVLPYPCSLYFSYLHLCLCFSCLHLSLVLGVSPSCLSLHWVLSWLILNCPSNMTTHKNRQIHCTCGKVQSNQHEQNMYVPAYSILLLCN